MPLENVVHPLVPQMSSASGRQTHHPTTNPIFREIDRRHDDKQDVMHIGKNRRGQLVPTSDPGRSDREQRFQRVKRCKPEEKSDGRTEGDRMRRIRNR